MEKPHIDVIMTDISAKEDDDKKFQVLIDWEENVALHDAIYEMHARNHLNEDQEARNIKTGKEEWRSDQESVDCCEKSCKEMKKNDAETKDYSDSVETYHKWHKICYRTKQNNEKTNFDNSFLCTPQLQCKKAIYTERFIKKVSLVTENEVRSKNYAVEASKREK